MPLSINSICLTRVAIGGRNQHFALHFASPLHADGAPIAELSVETDDIDCNSGGAGSVVD
jgi:glycerate-2-kinase